MKRRYRLLAPITILGLALALPLPAFAKPGHGHGNGQGHSASSRGGHSDHGGGWKSSGEHGRAQRSWDGGGSSSRTYARSSDWGSRSGNWGSRSGEWGGERLASRTVYRSRDWSRSGDWDRSRYAGRVYYRSGGYGGGGYVRYARYDGPYYSPYAYRSYYVDGFHRPVFYGSGFSVGFVISSGPVYGYRFYDPYCGVTFATLDDYAYHCGEFGHPEALLMVDIRSGYPVATCGYHRGYWVVDDCG